MPEDEEEPTPEQKEELRRLLMSTVNIGIRACDDPEVSVIIRDIFYPDALYQDLKEDWPSLASSGHTGFSVRYKKGLMIRITRGDQVVISLQATQEQALDYLKRIAKAIVVLSPEKVEEVSQAFMQGLQEGVSEASRTKEQLQEVMERIDAGEDVPYYGQEQDEGGDKDESH